MQRNRWSLEEDKILINNRNNFSIPNLKELLPNRTVNSISDRLKILKIKRQNFYWTIEEESILRQNYRKTLDELEKLLPNRDKNAIKWRIFKLNLSPTQWKQEDDEVLKNNFRKPINEIINLLPNRTARAIKGRINFLELTRKEWTNEENSLLTNLYGKDKKCANDLVKSFNGRSKKSILSHASLLNLKSDRKTHEGFRLYEVNLNFWNKCEDLQCVLAGFIAADGNIYIDKNNKNIFSINIHQKDIKYLEDFCKYTNYKGPINKFKHVLKSGNISSMCNIKIHNVNQWIENLNKFFNITHQKSLTLQPPIQLSKDKQWKFLLGLLDGDGTVYIVNNKYIRIGFVTGSKVMAEWVRDLVENNFGIYSAKHNRKIVEEINKENGNKCYRYAISGKAAVMMYNFFQNMINLPKLSRKWNNSIANQILEETKQKYLHLFTETSNISPLSTYNSKKEHNGAVATQYCS